MDKVAWGRVFDDLPSGLTGEQRTVFDAVDLLVPAARLQYARIQEVAGANDAVEDKAARISDPHKRRELADTRAALQTGLMADVGSLIATIERLRQIVRRLPDDQGVRLAKRDFAATLKPYERARRHLEHLDRAIPAIAASGTGALGVLTWHRLDTDGSSHMVVTILPGHPSSHATATTWTEGAPPPIERDPESAVGCFWLTIGEAPYYVTGAHDGVCVLEERLRAWSKQLRSPSSRTSD